MRFATLPLLACALLLGGLEVGAQQRPVADTLTKSPEEIHRDRQRALLERLARTPGADTLGLAADTLGPGPAGRAGAVGPVGGLPGFPTPGAVTPGLRATPPGGRAGLDGDTLIDRLLTALPGYESITYGAARARFAAGTRDLFLVGDTARKVDVVYQSMHVSADSSIHFNTNEVVEAHGSPVFTAQDGQPVNSRLLYLNTRTQEASAFGAKTEYTQGATWFVTGDLPRIRTDLVYASHARFTSCSLDVPHYHFAAEQIKIVRGNILVARSVRLYFADVPVFWFPFFAQSLATGRASGLLTPRVSINDIVRTSGGYQRRVSNLGFYWAMNDYADATFALDWYSGNFTALTTSLRYRWLSRFLSGTINARQFWRETGGKEFSLNSQQAWELSERASLTAQLAFVTSAAFVRQNTFDPLEATQSITSSGGLTRRFDFGTLNVLGSRSQSLSDDRVDLTFPRATLSVKPITLFAAPSTQARWFNNVTWNTGANASRRTLDYPTQPDTLPFNYRLSDQGTSQFAFNHGFSLGNLSIGQDLRVQQNDVSGVPLDTLPFYPGIAPENPTSSRRVDISQTALDWSTSLSYQQTLVGSTSLTPSISVSSSALRSDTLEFAQTFVSAPTRLHLSAALRSQLFGFFPGFGPFEAVRHKLSPGFTYTWAPEVTPTDLQRQVFGANELLPQRAITVSLSQTFEAKRSEPAEGPAGAGRIPPPFGPDAGVGVDTLLVNPLPAVADTVSGGPTRRAQSQVVMLLSVNTSAVSYDWVRADSAGAFLQGFTTVRIRNEIGSDYLRGLSLSVEHDLFRDTTLVTTATRNAPFERSFAPHLSAVNLRFSLNARSPIFSLFRRGASDDEATPPAGGEEYDPESEFDFSRGVTDEASILPGRVTGQPGQQTRPAPRDWSASVTYALTRPREASSFQETSQLVRVALTTSPTPQWRMAWRTSYDLEGGEFTDHIVSLTRDLHRWQANFDFLKTATGNWAFRFEVSLMDNRDLKFDFDQRSVEGGGLLPR